MSLNVSAVCLNHSGGPSSVFLVSTYSSIFIVGLVLNVVALFFFLSRGRSRSHTVVYMTNLAVADLLLLLTLPVRVFYHLGFSDLPRWACEGLGLVLKANMYASIFCLTCISLDRCVAVRFPMSPRVREVRKKAWLFCGGIWILTFGAGVPVYLSGRRPVSGGECFDAPPVYAARPGAVLPTLSLGFGIPLLVMLLSSWGLVDAVRRSAVAQTGLVDGAKIQRMIATGLLIFLLSFLPYHATLLLLHVHRERIECSVAAAYRYSLLVACLNTVLDPLAYYFTTDTFRRSVGVGAVRRMFHFNSHVDEGDGQGRDREDRVLQPVG